MTKQRAVCRRLVLAAIFVLMGIGVALPAAAEEMSAATVKVAYTPALGKFLTDSQGMTLYLYTKDQPGVSNCYDRCASNWPPLLLQSGLPTAPAGLPGQLGLAVRKDGTAQVTYNGAPLYYWVNDKQAGDTSGQNAGNVWYVVNPAPTVQVRADAKLGNYLVDAVGMTLYLYKRDTPGVSNCYDRCATNWPPVLVAYGQPSALAGLPGKLDLTARKDGAQQVTYNGMPLYYWINDRGPGDTTGQGVGEVWYVVNP